MRLGLRAQLLIVSSLLLALPWLGLRAAREIETFLIETQEQGLASTARAVATALNERPGVFVTDAGAPTGGPMLRIETLARSITVDGTDADWIGQRGDWREVAGTLVDASPAPASAVPAVSPQNTGGMAPALSTPGPTPGPSASPVGSGDALAPAPPPVSFRYRIGRYERGVFALVEVRDARLVRAEAAFPAIAQSDRVEVAMVSADDEFLRFAVAPTQDGAPAVVTIRPDGSTTPDTRVEAALQETATGYRVELRLPRTLVGARLSLAAFDVVDPLSRRVASFAGTSRPELRDELSRVFVPSPELSALAQGLGRARSRLWVVDAEGRVLAQAGALRAEGATAPPTLRQRLVMTLRPVYGSILAEPIEDFTDLGPDAERLSGDEVLQALQGRSARGRRRTTDGRAAVLSSAEPVWSDGRVVGAVLAEETTNETLAARNRAFEKLFFSIVGVVGFGVITLLLFATRLSFRIRRLRDAVETAIDRQGRVRGEIAPSSAGDEVGDLARSFASMLDRQRQYTAYLEQLRSRLSHEIRTPVAIVRSSLDNLRLQPLPENAAVYLGRAEEGLTRLVTIMQRMTEASRLEQTLATSEKEVFDLARVARGCVEGYRVAHPGRSILFEADEDGAKAQVSGAPDLVAQLLDKLVDNALDFAREGTPVEVKLKCRLGFARLSVSNEGPPLPPEVAERLFESMVSSRPADGAGGVHLGLGLSIVRAIAEFHEATVTASNRRESEGVTFTVTFPVAGSAL